MLEQGWKDIRRHGSGRDWRNVTQKTGLHAHRQYCNLKSYKACEHSGHRSSWGKYSAVIQQSLGHAYFTQCSVFCGTLVKPKCLHGTIQRSSRDTIWSPTACMLVLAKHQTQPVEQTNQWGHSATLMGPDCFLLTGSFFTMRLEIPGPLISVVQYGICFTVICTFAAAWSL